jgi:site-specific recombinase XerD
VSPQIALTPLNEPQPDLEALLPSWEIALRAEGKSASTRHSYPTNVRKYLRWCDDNGHPRLLDRTLVRGWIAERLDDGMAEATVVAMQLAVRRFSAWLEVEREIPTDPLIGLKAPKIPTKVVPSLTDDECKRLVKACEGSEFRDLRDEAIVRLMMETGIRRAELMALEIPDVDVGRGLAIIRKGKNSKGRMIPFGPKTGRAIDRYLRRARRSHRLATQTQTMWLGDGGKTFGYHGLRFALAYRAELAGLKGFHPHVLRHTAAARWLAAGGSEGGLMAVAGWSGRDMIDRYTAATASSRAADEARGLHLGDL